MAGGGRRFSRQGGLSLTGMRRKELAQKGDLRDRGHDLCSVASKKVPLYHEERPRGDIVATLRPLTTVLIELGCPECQKREPASGRLWRSK